MKAAKEESERWCSRGGRNQLKEFFHPKEVMHVIVAFYSIIDICNSSMKDLKQEIMFTLLIGLTGNYMNETI